MRVRVWAGVCVQTMGNGVIVPSLKHFRRWCHMLNCCNSAGFKPQARVVAVAFANKLQSFTPSCLHILAIHQFEVCSALCSMCPCLLMCKVSQKSWFHICCFQELKPRSSGSHKCGLSACPALFSLASCVVVVVFPSTHQCVGTASWGELGQSWFTCH